MPAEDRAIVVSSKRNRRKTTPAIVAKISAGSRKSISCCQKPLVQSRFVQMNCDEKPLLRIQNKQKRLRRFRTHVSGRQKNASFLWLNMAAVILQNNAIPLGLKLFGLNIVFQLCKDYLQHFEADGSIKVMEWPPRNPDLNLIELLREELGWEVGEAVQISKAYLWKKLQEARVPITPDTLTKLIARRPRLSAAVIKSKDHRDESQDSVRNWKRTAKKMTDHLSLPADIASNSSLLKGIKEPLAQRILIILRGLFFNKG
ncbi:hypothetical protein Trydic_g22528 [Trypoxylus dichotomus]